MQVIVSHDVDHLYWKDHWFRDLYIPKMMALSAKQLLGGAINAGTFFKRINFLADKRINRIRELTAYEESKGIRSTFFFGMNNGLSLSYSQEEAKPFILEQKNKGFGVGVHGQAYSDFNQMTKEFADFKQIVQDDFGIRMHYLRQDNDTLAKQGKIGFTFDSTVYEVNKPYKIGNMWEIPLTVMDVYAVRPNKQNLEIAKKYTLDIIAQSEQKNIPYFVVNFHDLYFCDAYAVYRDWFTWTVETLQQKGLEFTTFEQAVKELNNKGEML